MCQVMQGILRLSWWFYKDYFAEFLKAFCY